MRLSRWLKPIRKATAPARPPAGSRLGLERLEDRVTPSTTNISIAIAPNFFSGRMTETLTATVSPSAGDTGTPTGNFKFNVNNQTAIVGIGANNSAMATFNLPVTSLLAGQSVNVGFQSTSLTFTSSFFNSPVYTNLDNLLFPSAITFGAPPSNFTNSTGTGSSTVFQFNSAFGETDTVTFFFIPVTFNYVDPGTVTSVNAFGFNFPGFLSSSFVNPFAPIVFPTSSSSSM
jgi:hypothetical protein